MGQSTALKRAGSSFSRIAGAAPEGWRQTTDQQGKKYYYHEITQATTYEMPVPLSDNWKLTRDTASGVVYFYNTLTLTTLPFGQNPPGCEAAAKALRSGLTPPPPGPPPRIKASITKGEHLMREPRTVTATYGEVAALKLQLDRALGSASRGPAYNIVGAAGSHDLLATGEIILTIDGVQPADVAEATTLLQTADAKPELADAKTTLTIVDSRSAEEEGLKKSFSILTPRGRHSSR